MFSLGILLFKLNGHVFKFERRMRFKNSKCAEQENAWLQNAISCFKSFVVRLIVLVCCQREAVVVLFASTFTVKSSRINGKMRGDARLSSVFNKLKL